MITLTHLYNSLIAIDFLHCFIILQASLIVVLNWLTIIFLFTSTLGFDVKRVQSEKYDLLCCSGRLVGLNIRFLRIILYW